MSQETACVLVSIHFQYANNHINNFNSCMPEGADTEEVGIQNKQHSGCYHIHSKISPKEAPGYRM